MEEDDLSFDDPMMAEFEEIKQDVAEGREPSRSVRELLRCFGARRRRTGVIERIEAELEAAGIRTEPHFTTVWIDAPIVFKKREAAEKKPAAIVDGVSSTPAPTENEAQLEEEDTTHLVRMLAAANRDIVSVNPQDSLEKAVTLMLAHDFSQLAIMTGPRDLKGAISWKSIGSRLTQKSRLEQVSDALEDAVEVHDTTSLFEATQKIINCDYVFVRSSFDKKITGIVTATDLSVRFQRYAEPFLLLGRIEKHLRRIIDTSFDIDTIRAALDPSDLERNSTVTKASQLSFGEYIRIFQKEANWARLKFSADRKTFCDQLDEVRKMRNEIMHFHLDEVDDEESEPIRRFARLLDQLERLSG
ncbi:MAG: CBS domain-containing protein [Roseomonas sp.]